MEFGAPTWSLGSLLLPDRTPGLCQGEEEEEGVLWHTPGSLTLPHSEQQGVL